MVLVVAPEISIDRVILAVLCVLLVIFFKLFFGSTVGAAGHGFFDIASCDAF